MVTKKPAEKKEEEKEPVPIIPPRAETPKLLKAALEMSEKSGKKGSWAKLKERSNRSSISLQVHINIACFRIVICSKIIHCLDNLGEIQNTVTSSPLCPSHLAFHLFNCDAQLAHPWTELRAGTRCPVSDIGQLNANPYNPHWLWRWECICWRRPNRGRRKIEMH